MIGNVHGRLKGVDVASSEYVFVTGFHRRLRFRLDVIVTIGADHAAFAEALLNAIDVTNRSIRVDDEYEVRSCLNQTAPTFFGLGELGCAGCDALFQLVVRAIQGLARRKTLADVGDATSNQIATRVGQADQTDFTRNLLTGRIHVYPFKNWSATGKRFVDKRFGQRGRISAVWLFLRSHFCGADREQRFVIQPEQPFRVRVGVGEFSRVGVE